MVEEDGKEPPKEQTNAENQSETPHRSKYDLDPEYLTMVEKRNIISVLVVLIAILVFIVMSFNSCKKCFSDLERERTYQVQQDNFKTYWVYGRNVESGYLHNVFYVLDRLGYKNDPNTTDWNLLWAHDYPFTALQTQIANMKPFQKVNKLPGSGYITNKVDLATSDLKYIPAAFRLPRDKDKLIKYAQENSDVKFVQKSNDHRNIHIKKIEEIDLDSKGNFVQKFIDKPLLVDGLKFDIGVYTIITSVEPLRVYIYNGDALLRFCPKKYQPFDPNDIDKYVVGDDYIPTWNVPSLKYYYKDLGFGMKNSLNAYLRSQDKDPSIIWDQIEEAIRIVALDKEAQIITAVNRYPYKQNFFEMMRFDFIVDENLNVFLMEANMSPNLSSAHFPPNKLLFEQVIFNLFSLIRIASRTQDISLGVPFEQEMQVSDKNIAVFPRECSGPLCRNSCMSPVCLVCKPCMMVDTKNAIKEAYLEHVNKADCKRIFPPPISRTNTNINIEDYTPENQLIYRWFLGKCLLDVSWCN